MHTFNLGLVFGEAEHVIIIVCASEKPMERQNINCVATQYFQQGLTIYSSMDQVISYMVDGIKQDCNCEAVIVKADAACMIPRK